MTKETESIINSEKLEEAIKSMEQNYTFDERELIIKHVQRRMDENLTALRTKKTMDKVMDASGVGKALKSVFGNGELV